MYTDSGTCPSPHTRLASSVFLAAVMAAINSGIDDVGKGGEIDDLLRQLSLRVMEDRKSLLEQTGL